MKHFLGNKKYTNGYSYRLEENNSSIGTFSSIQNRTEVQNYISLDGLRMATETNKYSIELTIWDGWGWHACGYLPKQKLANAIHWISTGDLVL